MRLTLFNEAKANARTRVAWVLDSDTRSIEPPASSDAIRISRKLAELLLLLAYRRLGAAADPNLGWVELSEISSLRHWSGARTFTSLAAQVRREIKALHRICPGLVEAPLASQLKGPFRLICVPRADRNTLRMLTESYAALSRTHQLGTTESLYTWLEHSEPVWRSFHYFDKPGEALSSFPAIDGAIGPDPLVKALGCIGSAKRFRELGEYARAQRTIAAAAAFAHAEPDIRVRHYLEAMCLLQRAWLSYRKGDLDAAERGLASVDGITTSDALLRLRGQMLNLRSLIRRSRGMYAAALDDLASAARLFVVEGDLFHLFAVYHNLACLIAAEAAHESETSRRNAMLSLALIYSQRNEAYCHQYRIGQNSVLNKLLQVGLHRSMGNAKLALSVACDAERLALDSQNFPDAMVAHRHRLSILLEDQLLREAKEAHQATTKMLRDPEIKRRFATIYDGELLKLLAPDLAANTQQPKRRRRSRRIGRT